MNSAELRSIASGISEILDQVYRRDPALSDERTQKMIDSVATGDLLLFVLVDGDVQVVVTTSFTKLPSAFPDSPTTSFEAGRTVKAPKAPKNLAGDLILISYLWFLANLSTCDYIIANTRAGQMTDGRPYNGGVLRRALSYKSAVPANITYSHSVARSAVEPFVSVFGAIDAVSWGRQVKQQRILLPAGLGMQLFESMLVETTGASITHTTPQITEPASAGVTVYEVIEPSAHNESAYFITSAHIPGWKTVEQIPHSSDSEGSHVSTGLSDKAIIENDVLSSQDIGPLLGSLSRQGFHLAGWTPSERQYGNIALVLSRPGFLPAEGIPAIEADLSAMSGFPAARLFLQRTAEYRPARTVHG